VCKRISPVTGHQSLITSLASIVVLAFLIGIAFPTALAQQRKKPFTVVDEIGLALFDAPNGGPGEVLFSPDGDYFIVKAEHGRLDINRVEDDVRFYRTQEVIHFLDYAETSRPSPVWTFARTGKEGGVIGGWRWLADSNGIAFLEPTESGNQRIVLADLQKKTVEPLTSSTEAVKDFDIRDRQHYVYTVVDPAGQENKKAEREVASVVGTGRSLFELILPDDPISARIAPATISLWAVEGGKPFEVKENGAPLANFGTFALSPDGKSLVTTLPVLDVPSAWETSYPSPPTPPCSVSPCTNRIHAGHYDAKSSQVHQYVRVDLQTGTIGSLAEAPLANDAGWLAFGDPSWSRDGREILLPNTFLKSKDNLPSRPCIAVMDASSDASTCVEVLKAHKTETTVEEGYHLVVRARFAAGTGRVMVGFSSHEDQSYRTTEYQLTNHKWQAVREIKGLFPAEQNGLEVSVTEGLNDPPVLIAKNEKTSRVILDPNPQLQNVELGQASVYTWKDNSGRQWKGGLYKPVNYKLGQRYPLVIQTHGFSESEFRPSGVFPTAFAARALAATGIMVLQTAIGVAGANCPSVTPEEGRCAVAMLESAANQLVSDGLVDREQIGIIGFSRTCFSVMEILTTSSLHLKAASITDGVMFDYLGYILFTDRISSEADRVIGAPPFGDGLRQWLKRSPGFNLDKITTPLLVVGEGPLSLLSMWQPYAGLHYLQKPVDLIMLNTDEHVLTTPAVRMVSQGGSVDWFRFWLQDYEDPDPAKNEQYERWRGLRKMQEENEKKAAEENGKATPAAHIAR
jgi:dipeptidyl aminopeptidase/acylaminoacyl peptidase